MSYPLAETVVRTLRNVEFGTGYSPDEPAPSDVATIFRGLIVRHRIREAARLAWESAGTHAAWESYSAALAQWDRRHNDLLRVMGKHLYKSYLCDGYRIRLIIEPENCRRHHVQIQEVPE